MCLFTMTCFVFAVAGQDLWHLLKSDHSSVFRSQHRGPFVVKYSRNIQKNENRSQLNSGVYECLKAYFYTICNYVSIYTILLHLHCCSAFLLSLYTVDTTVMEKSGGVD